MRQCLEKSRRMQRRSEYRMNGKVDSTEFMCGIGGIHLSKSSGRSINSYEDAFLAIKKSLIERGPDDQNICIVNPRLGMVHTRLSIQDPDSIESKQPAIKDNLILSYNGEIYNHLELRREKLRDFTFKSMSDTETLLALITKFGVTNAVKMLDGIYAFSLFDANNSKLYLVRDHIGIKPLFYWNDKRTGKLIWGSYPSSIVKATKRKWKLNHQVLEQCMLFGSPFGEETLFTGIRSVPSATIISFDDSNNESPYRHYLPSFSNVKPEEALLRDIPLQRLADVPKTIFLSGGIDSSYLLTLLDCKEAYHLQSAEIKYAKEIANLCGAKLNIVSPANENMSELFYSYASITGQININSIIPQTVSKALSEQKFKVGYAGHGADELFFGYDRISESSLGDDPKDRFKKINDQLSFFIRSPQLLSKSHRQSEINTPPDWALNHVVNLSFPNSLPVDSAQRIIELKTYTEYSLLPVLDHASMMYRVEMRVPFLSPQIINSALSKDASYHCQPHGRKSILKKRLLANGVCRDFIDRRKKGFSLNKRFLMDVFKEAEQSFKACILPDTLKISTEFFRENQQYANELAKFFSAYYQWKKVWVDSGIVYL